MMARMDSPPVQEKTSATTLRELAALFTKLGFTAFGGPAAHVALMEDEIVVRRAWIDHQHFLDLVAAVNFIPGPNSTELAIHIGQLRAGFRGLLVAGRLLHHAGRADHPADRVGVREMGHPAPGAAAPAHNGAAIAGVVLFATLRFGKDNIEGYLLDRRRDDRRHRRGAAPQDKHHTSAGNSRTDPRGDRRRDLDRSAPFAGRRCLPCRWGFGLTCCEWPERF